MKWGILATGTIAKKFAETVCQMDPSEAVLTAVGSRTSESARAFAEAYGIPRYYGSYEDLAKDPEVEAIYISTPNHMHYENCMMCLEAGKHVLCENHLLPMQPKPEPFTTWQRKKDSLLWRPSGFVSFLCMTSCGSFWIRESSETSAMPAVNLDLLPQAPERIENLIPA